MRVIGTFLLASMLLALFCTKGVLSASLPSTEAILDETIQQITLPAKVGDMNELAAIAVRQAKVSSCAKAKVLFRTAIDLSEKWSKETTDKLRIESRVGFLNRVMADQRAVGCVEEMKYTAERVLVLYQEQNLKRLAESEDNDFSKALHNLQYQLNIGNLYLSQGDFNAARGVALSIVQQIRVAKWRPSIEFESAAAFLARLERDEEAFEVVRQYERFFEARSEIKEDISNKHWWIYRISILAAVAEAQAEAGHKEEARATLRRAIDKARGTPVVRLNKVYGEKETRVEGKPGLHKIGEGEALQSAAFMRVVWHAAEMGETALALEAFESVYARMPAAATCLYGMPTAPSEHGWIRAPTLELAFRSAGSSEAYHALDAGSETSGADESA